MAEHRTGPRDGKSKDAKPLPRPRGAVPLGFRVTEDGQGIEPDDAGLESVRLILRRRAEGRSYARIAAELEREGHATARGGGWYASTVRAVWRRRARYVGLVDAPGVLRVLLRGRDY